MINQMTEYDVKRLALVLAVQAEIEGMKAENQIALINKKEPIYNGNDFNAKAEEIRNIAYRHEDLL